MKKGTYQKIGIIFPIIVAISFSLGIVFDNSILPIFVVVIGIPIIFIAKSRVEGVLEDERHHKIGGYAGRYAIVLYCLLGAIIGLTLIVQKNPVTVAVAHTLLGSISVILMFYIILFSYFEKKM